MSKDEIGQYLMSPQNSLTPDDRLFLAYLAAWISETAYNGPQLAAKHGDDIRKFTAKYMCENYKEQEK